MVLPILIFWMIWLRSEIWFLSLSLVVDCTVNHIELENSFVCLLCYKQVRSAEIPYFFSLSCREINSICETLSHFKSILWCLFSWSAYLAWKRLNLFMSSHHLNIINLVKAWLIKINVGHGSLYNNSTCIRPNFLAWLESKLELLTFDIWSWFCHGHVKLT